MTDTLALKTEAEEVTEGFKAVAQCEASGADSFRPREVDMLFPVRDRPRF